MMHIMHSSERAESAVGRTVKQLWCALFCLYWTLKETSTKRSIFLYIKTSWMHPHLSTWSTFYKTKKLSVSIIPEKIVLNSLEINPNTGILSVYCYQWQASAHVCYYRYIKHWFKEGWECDILAFYKIHGKLMSFTYLLHLFFLCKSHISTEC